MAARTLRFAVLLLFGLLPLADAQAENHYEDSVKVKSNLDGGFFIDDDYSATLSFECVNTGFAPQSPPAQIAPGSGDPGHSTTMADVMHIPNCWMDCSSGQCGAVWDWNFPSLQDLGVWSFTCSGVQVDPAYCTGTCVPTCALSAPVAEAIPYTINITVWNDPPTASISHSPTPAWNQTVTLSANSNDPDGGAVNHTWSVIERPTASSASLSSTTVENPTIAFSSEEDIGTWRFRLHVDDNEGERKTFTHEFEVPNGETEITISGNLSVQALLEDIDLQVTPTDDVDGGALVITWDLVSSPPGASVGPQSGFEDGFNGPEHLFIPTTDADIGEWVLRATAEDNEGFQSTATVTVQVENIPPEIDLVGPGEIDIGEAIQVETTVLDDADNVAGGGLTFQWDIVQAPQGATPAIQENFSSDFAIFISTGYEEAGTYIFRLTVTDDEPPPWQESVSADFAVVVDAPPEAVITGDPVIGSLSLPLVLSGEDSLDPDSPCPDAADRCHDRLDGGLPEDISPAIVQYTWTLVSVPLELITEYPLGRVDDALGLPAHNATLELGFGDIEPGEWVFQLEVTDGEGNTDHETFTAQVIEEEGPPIAQVFPPFQRHTVDVLGVTPGAIGVSGALSFDLDNVLIGDPLAPGVGIADYAWDIGLVPPGCTPPPPSGPGTTQFEPFAAGAAVDFQCQGRWEVGLTVSDDDPTPKTARAASAFVIGNCASLVCIDNPTTAFPAIVEFTDNTNILIFYHLDSALYDDPRFIAGMFAKLEIFHESDLANPVKSAHDPNLLASNRGGYLVFHWDGFTDAGARPQPGRYTVRISLADSSLVSSAINATETDAIFIAVADPEIAASSDDYAVRERLLDGTDAVTLDYQIVGGATTDELRWRIFDASDTLIHEDSIAAAMSGTIEWDGVAGGTTIPAGSYTAELEALRGGSSLGVSPRHGFAVFRVDLDVDPDRNGTVADAADEADEDDWTKPRGATFAVNYDRDGSRTSGGLPIPDTLHIDDSGTPIDEDRTIDNAADEADVTPLVLRGAGADLPPSVTVVLRVAEKEDIQSVHVFKRIAAGETAIWGSLGDRVGGAPEPLERDITQWVNPASGMFLGAGPADDIVFGLEGIFFRSLGAINPFDGEIDITLEMRDGGTVVAADSARLKVAPWVVLPHTGPSTEMWAEDAGAINEPFRQNAGADPGYFGLDNSGQLNTTSSPDAGSQWIQDHLEMGYYQRPGGPKTHGVLRLPYFQTPVQPVWPMKELLKPEAGTFQLGRDLGGEAGDFGGNLELLPPTSSHPLGRIVIGTTRSAELWTFLNSQEVQAPLEVPTDWLNVSHVDEVFAFTPTSGQVIVADPSDAYALLNAIDPADRGRSTFFATGKTPEVGVASADASANDRLETGIDHTGETWEYVRIYADSGSGASGQVAHIATLGSGFIEVDEVWDVPTKIIPGGGAPVTLMDHLFSAAPSQSTWFDNPAAGDKYVLVEGTRFWFDDPSNGDGTPAIVTVEEVLADADLEALNTIDIQNKINDIRTMLNAAAGGTLTFTEVPTIYVGERAGFDTGRSAVAFTPGLANVQPANGKLYFPRQFGPVDIAGGGGDLFEKTTVSRLPDALFVDDWDLYHRLEGEVHCGSNVKRVPFALDWWDHQP